MRNPARCQCDKREHHLTTTTKEDYSLTYIRFFQSTSRVYYELPRLSYLAGSLRPVTAIPTVAGRFFIVPLTTFLAIPLRRAAGKWIVP